MSENSGETRRFSPCIRKPLPVGEIMERVHAALVEKGHNPVNQLAGFILSGDPTYITNHRGARALVSGLDREEVVEELLRFYLRSCDKDEAAARHRGNPT